MISIIDVEQRLLEDEGEVLYAYEDSEGYLTIGVGHLIDKRRGGVISQAASRYILHEDIVRAERSCIEHLPWFVGLDRVRQQVLVCCCFQLGLAGLLAFKKMLAATMRGDYGKAADEMLDSQWAKQTPKRCELMASIMRSGEWPGPKESV